MAIGRRCFRRCAGGIGLGGCFRRWRLRLGDVGDREREPARTEPCPEAASGWTIRRYVGSGIGGWLRLCQPIRADACHLRHQREEFLLCLGQAGALEKLLLQVGLEAQERQRHLSGVVAGFALGFAESVGGKQVVERGLCEVGLGVGLRTELELKDRPQLCLWQIENGIGNADQANGLGPFGFLQAAFERLFG